MFFVYFDQIGCRIIEPCAAPLKTLAHRQNAARLSLFYWYYFGRCSSKLGDCFFFLIFVAGQLVILAGCIFLLSPFLDVVRMPMSTVFSWHIKTLEFCACRMVSFHLLSKWLYLETPFIFGFLLNSFLICFSSFSSFSYIAMPCSGRTVIFS